jgi:catechol 2,3-dioxygenase-like lactoylglutathione lyase family enzyme
VKALLPDAIREHFRIGDAKERRMITRLSHSTLFVTSQDKAYDFYVNKLGFRVNTDLKMEDGGRWLTVNPPGQPDLEIVLAEPAAPMFDEDLIPHVRALLARNSLGGGVWETPNCREAFEELKAKGVVFTKEPTEEFYGTEALFLDGCGNWFSLSQRKE